MRNWLDINWRQCS